MASLQTILNNFAGRAKARGQAGRVKSSLADKIRADKRVLALEVEPVDGWFVTLKAGWKSASDPMLPVHCFGASTLTEAMREIRAALPCTCDQCKAELAAENSAMPGLGTTITVDEAIAYVRKAELGYSTDCPKGEIIKTSQTDPAVVFVYTKMSGDQPWAVWREPDSSSEAGSYIYGEW